IQLAVAEKFESVAVERIGAGFGHGIHGSCGAPPSEASCVLVLSRNSCSASGNGSGMFCPNHVSRCEAPSREYCTLKDVPPATEIWTPPFIVYAGETFCTTAAPPNEIRSVGCRPLSGRSRIRCVRSTILDGRQPSSPEYRPQFPQATAAISPGGNPVPALTY